MATGSKPLIARPVSGLTANWLSVAAFSVQGAKIPPPIKNGRFRCCRAAVIVLGEGCVIRDNLSSPIYYRGRRELPVKQGLVASPSIEDLIRTALRFTALQICFVNLAPLLAADNSQPLSPSPPPAQQPN